MNIYATADKNGNIYLTVPKMPGLTSEAGIYRLGSSTINLNELIKRCVREVLDERGGGSRE